jgi:hypothetical protein
LPPTVFPAADGPGEHRAQIARGAEAIFIYVSYFDRVARHVQGLADDVDVVVLAQASMAPAADLVGDLSIPVLGSPRLAVLRAVELAGL